MYTNTKLKKHTYSFTIYTYVAIPRLMFWKLDDTIWNTDGAIAHETQIHKENLTDDERQTKRIRMTRTRRTAAYLQ